jgi:hypothetical protein
MLLLSPLVLVAVATVTGEGFRSLGATPIRWMVLGSARIVHSVQ